jgi:hypothetical protein
MQTIFKTSLTPEQYAEQDYQKQVQPPLQCPNCEHAHTLEALGYYARFVTQVVAAVLEIWVRRFSCRHCGISVSCLPQFAQPYRVVNTDTVQAAFNGQRTGPAVQRWWTLIRTYWRSFQAHVPELVQRVGQDLGPLPLQATASDLWQGCLHACGGLAQTTQKLIDRFRTCLFGTYRCHQRKPIPKQAKTSRAE